MLQKGKAWWGEPRPRWAAGSHPPPRRCSRARMNSMARHDARNRCGDNDLGWLS